MSRPGLTLLELLLALALLSGLAMAAVAWTTTSVDSSRMLSARVRWENAANATLRLIERDLATGDTRSGRFGPGAGQPSLEVEPGLIRIPTRQPPYTGRERTTYRFDESGGILTRRTTDETGHEGDEIVLLGDLAAVEFEVTQRDLRDRPVVLRISMDSTSDWRVDRLVRLEYGGEP